MHTKNQRRWHLMINSHGYRPGDDPMTLLDILIKCTEHDGGALLGRVIADSHAQLIELTLDAPEFSALVDSPLCEPEIIVAIESATLVFASRLARGWLPGWILRDTYLGGRVRQLAAELWRPRQGSAAAEARETFEQRWQQIELPLVQFVGSVDAGKLPSGEACRHLADALEGDAGVASEQAYVWIRRARGLLHAIAEEGIAGWQLRYMSAVTERARIKSVAGQSGIRGAVENIADDVARPLLRQSRRPPLRPRRVSRSRLCRARATVMSRWMYRREPRWRPEQLERLDAIPETASSSS